MGSIFEKFHIMIQTQFQATIHAFKTDINAKEYFSSIFGNYLSSKSIIHISYCVDTQQQSGIS